MDLKPLGGEHICTIITQAMARGATGSYSYPQATDQNLCAPSPSHTATLDTLGAYTESPELLQALVSMSQGNPGVAVMTADIIAQGLDPVLGEEGLCCTLGKVQHLHHKQLRTWTDALQIDCDCADQVQEEVVRAAYLMRALDQATAKQLRRLSILNSSFGPRTASVLLRVSVDQAASALQVWRSWICGRL